MMPAFEITRRTPSLALTCLMACAATGTSDAVPTGGRDTAEHLHYEITATLNPSARSIDARVQIHVPDSLAMRAGDPLRLSLHRGLAPRVSEARPKRQQTSATPNAHGINHTKNEGSVVAREAFEVTLPTTRVIDVRYAGEIHHPIERKGEEYARSFAQTPGLIDPEGVYLAGSTGWLPRPDDGLFTFSLTVKLPAGWDAVSEGRRTKHQRGASGSEVRWESSTPVDELHVIAAPFTEYHRTVGDLEIYAFLRAPDDGLAEKYITTTSQYTRMYGDLLGRYPYAKFALIENFWETGFGMPSFTLLGPKVIRMPFILHSSYPHEILHNWWGNGVFVDYETGNWCEGLTAYLADHLIKEQRGQGTGYRRTSLQRYSDYVATSEDFPIAEFRARHSSVTQAVGYDKLLMVYHMVRRQIGDDAFRASLQRFYRDNRFRRASFDDLATAFDDIEGFDAEAFFTQWVDRAGAPALELVDARAETGRLTVTVRQTQSGPPFVLDIPIAVTLAQTPEAFHTVVRMSERELTHVITVPGDPVRVDIDPEFDLFRRLDTHEIPPALSGVFGAEQVSLVLPSEAPRELLAAYRALAETWQSSAKKDTEVLLDSELDALPPDRAVWLFGWSNRHRSAIESAASAHARFGGDIIEAGHDRLSKSEHSVIVTARHPEAPARVIAWLATDNPKALPGLGRKLPHYGKYGYLAFSGDEPTNVAKGDWPINDSPLSRLLTSEQTPTGTLPARSALAELPPVFDASRMLETVRFLASPELAGRGFGSPELDEAAEWIAQRFALAQVEPAGDAAGSWFQSFEAEGGEPPRTVQLRNVVGIVRGSDPKLVGQSVVVGAHYDHLGRGWPNPRDGQEGKIHPGADDNASGIAVLLELARHFATKQSPARTIVFVAFAGEEAGLLGSKHYVTSDSSWAAKNAIAMINLDTVGHLESNKLTILGTGTAREWVHIFFGAGYVTGTPVQPVPDDIGGSDQKSFIEVGIPAVQLFSGPHLGYHHPDDTPDGIDADGLVKVASIAAEAIDYLAGRIEPLNRTGDEAQPADAHTGARKVSLGTIPDFAFAGPGVRITGTTPESPAAKAGLREGDVVVQIGTTTVESLRDLSNALKAHTPGDRVTVVLVRDEERVTVDVTLVAR